MTDRTVRIFFDGVGSAAEGLRTVLEDARESKHFYKITGLSLTMILHLGILLEGQIDEIVAKLDELPGALPYEE